MDTNEYLEKITSDTYKRESDQDENVARSLPFFATSLALLATVLGLVKSALPPFEFSAFPLLLFGCLGVVGVAVALVLFALLLAVWPRRFDYIMKESELLDYAKDLREFYSPTGATGQQLEDAVIADLREELINQYALGAMRNRATNISRLRARGFALSSLVVGLIFAFTLIGAIFTHDLMYGDGPHAARHASAADRTSPENRDDQGPNGASRAQTDPSSDAGGDQGGRSVAREASAAEGNQRAMSNNNSNSTSGSGNESTPAAPATSAPQQTATPAKPTAPPMQSFLRGSAEVLKNR